MAKLISNVQTQQNGISLSYAVPDVANRKLVVAIGKEDLNSNGPITGVTYGGVALTLVVGASAGPDGVSATQRVAIYELNNPAVGTATVSVTTENERTAFTVFTLSGVGSFGDTDAKSGTANLAQFPLTTTVTTTETNSRIISIGSSGEPASIAPPAGHTSIAQFGGSASQDIELFYTDVASPGTVNSTVTGFFNRGAYVSAVVTEFVGGTGVSADIATTALLPTVSASGSATLPQPSASISTTALLPSVSASGSATLPQPSANISTTALLPAVNATGSATLPQPDANVSVTSLLPVVAVTGSATQPGFNASVNVTALLPSVSVIGGATLPQPSASVSTTALLPTVSVTGSATEPNWSASVNVTALLPSVSVDATATLPAPSAAISVTGLLPTVSVTARVSGMEIYVAKNAKLIYDPGSNRDVLEPGSNRITLQPASNRITL